MRLKILAMNSSIKKNVGILLFIIDLSIPMLLYWTLENHMAQLSFLLFSILFIFNVLIVFFD